MRWLSGLLAAVFIVLVWQAASAALALTRLAGAAKSGDGATILSHTDMPAVRRSITQQVLAALARQAPERQTPERKTSALERVLGSQVGAAVIDAVLGQTVTADNLTHFLREGTIEPRAGEQAAPRSASSDRGLPDVGDALGRLRIAGPLEIAVRVSAADADYAGIRLRSNLLGWRLAGIDLPVETLNALAARVRKP